MFACLGLSFVPVIPVVGLGFFLIFFAVLFMLVRWQVKFGGLVTNDPDYGSARRAKNIALALWVLAIPLSLIVRPLVHYFVFGF